MDQRSSITPAAGSTHGADSWSADFHRKTVGPLLTLAALFAVEFLSDAVFNIPNPAIIFLLTIVYSAFLGGTGPGLVSAAITIGHSIIFYSVPGRLLYYAPEDLNRLVVIALAAVAVPLLVGRIKRNLDLTLARERVERAKAEAAERRTRFLAEASEMLTTSLDPQETLQNMAELTVSAIADYCVVDIVGPDGKVSRVAATHPEPERGDLASALQHFSTPLDQPVNAAAVLHTGKSILVSEVTEEHLEMASRDPEHLSALRGLAPCSLMIVPMVARERTLGAITFVSTNPNRRYSPDDLDLATDLGRRAALAVDTANLLQEAQQANRVKSDFLAVMSHELRTPLTAIIGFAELLSLGIPETLPPEAQVQVERISSAGQHLAQMIEEILTFARMEAGRETVQLEQFVLSDVVQDVATLMEPLAAEKGLSLDVKLPEYPIFLETDRRKLRQILLNLISNSIKFTEQGRIQVRTHLENGTAVLVVQDTGIGISAEHLDRIFEPFWQAEESRTRRFGGTGLGLNVVRQLADLLGGEVSVESRLGEGSIFTVHLPACIPEATESPSLVHSLPGSGIA